VTVRVLVLLLLLSLLNFSLSRFVLPLKNDDRSSCLSLEILLTLFGRYRT
jgi:hypothetical protein